MLIKSPKPATDEMSFGPAFNLAFLVIGLMVVHYMFFLLFMAWGLIFDRGISVSRGGQILIEHFPDLKKLIRAENKKSKDKKDKAVFDIFSVYLIQKHQEGDKELCTEADNKLAELMEDGSNKLKETLKNKAFKNLALNKPTEESDEAVYFKRSKTFIEANN